MMTEMIAAGSLAARYHNIDSLTHQLANLRDADINVRRGDGIQLIRSARDAAGALLGGNLQQEDGGEGDHAVEVQGHSD